MNKLFKKIVGAALGLTMAIGVGVAVGGNRDVRQANAAASSITFTTSASNLGYSSGTASNKSMTVSGVTITFSSITGKTTSPARVQAAKNSTITSTVFADSITSITLNDCAHTGSKSDGSFTVSCSANGSSWTQVYSTSTMSPSQGNVPITGITSGYKYFKVTVGNSRVLQLSGIVVNYGSDSTLLTGITLSGSEVGGTSPNYTLANIAKSDTSTNHTVSVGLTPKTATDPKVKVEHYDGDSVVDVYSSPVTCTSGTGSFNVRAKGTAVGTERLKIYGNTETSVVRYLSVTVYDDSVTNWTVSFNSDGGATIADMIVEDGDKFEFPNPGTKTHYSFDGWTSDGGNTLYDAGDESPAVDDDIEYTAYWTQDAQYTVTYSAGANGSGSYSATEYGGTYTLLAYASISGDTKVSASSGYRFKNYTVGGVNKDPGDTFTLSATTTITVNFEQIPPSDTLTATLIGQTSYGDWSGKSGGGTDAVYAGNSTKSSNGAIQMRTTNSNSGIVTTTSGGTIKSVTVTWNTTDLGSTARTLDVYAKTTAYSAATDLYSSSTQGTKVGSISYTNATTYETTLIITGDYTYVGVRSNTNALYLDDISFEWALPDTLESLAISGAIPTYTAGSTFSFGRTATAHYSQTGDVEVSTGLTFTLGGTAIAAGDTIPVNKVGTQAIVVTYTDSNSDSVSASAYNVTVNYKGATGIELNISEAPLSIGGTVSLTATVSDEYADPHDVSWASGNTSIATVSAASGTKTITVTGVSAGSATITATANGHSATCAISVTADPILNLKDSGDNIINDETLEFFTGDNSVMIQAVSENVASPVYSWENEDDSVVIIDVADEYCEVTIVGAGSSDVSVTVGALTRTVTFSIAQSGVTSLTLESSVPSGELFDGTYKNTLTLTPAVTLVGNATGVINWSSSDTDVATVSNASTSAPAAITVTGVGEGTATITARSVYTPSMSATFDVSVSADGVKTLSWTKRPKFNSSATGFQTIWAGETTLGNLMEQNGSDGIGVFAPNWESEKTDSPTMGTGAHDVHIVLSDVGGPTSEAGLTPLTSSYVFQATDNGKYVVAFYEGKASTNNTQLSVTKWRNVWESSTLSETFDYSAGGGNMSQSGDITTASIAKGGSTTIEADSLRLGSGSKTGSLTVTSSTNLISKIEVLVKSYGSDNATLNVGSENTGAISADEFESFEFTFDDPVSSVELSTTASSKRVYVQKVIITSGGLNDIGKSADCLGLEVYIDTYLHMSDYTTSEGWCKDEEHNYYGKNTETGAKYHFNQLNAHQRSLLSSNSAYAAEWARLSAWAAANGESLNSSSMLAAARITPLANIVGNTNTVAIIVIISMVSVTAIGGYFFLRKRKENN